MPPLWRGLSGVLRERFGGSVTKVPLDVGASCPNRDASGRGGCAWCDPGGSGPDGPERDLPWREALQRGARRASERGSVGVVAYLQAFTPTVLAPGELAGVIEGALGVPGVVGVAVGARPDCLVTDLLDALETFHRRTFLWVEVGMQTRHDTTLSAMNRGHAHGATERAAEALGARGFRTVLHLILGLPGETSGMIRESLSEASRLRPWGVKLHPLHVVRGSALEAEWARGGVRILSLPEFAALAADGLELLHPATVVHRLTGERPEGVLLAPEWCRDKAEVLAAIRRELARRGTRQGSLWR